MKRACLLIFLLSPTVYSGVYKCESNGAVSYQSQPCTDKEKESTINLPVRQSYHPSTEWDLYSKKDSMTDENLCIIESPISLVTGKVGGDFVTVKLRQIAFDNGEMAVGIYAETAFTDSNSIIFHNDIDGLGIRVDKNKFITVSDKAQHAILFNKDNSIELSKEFLEGSTAFARVRFWPYDRTYDVGPFTLSGYKSALDKLNNCIEKGSDIKN